MSEYNRNLIKGLEQEISGLKLILIEYGKAIGHYHEGEQQEINKILTQLEVANDHEQRGFEKDGERARKIAISSDSFETVHKNDDSKPFSEPHKEMNEAYERYLRGKVLK